MDKYAILRQVFGHDTFREGQETLVDALLAGRDCLGIMPTGAGKSMCYQVPALALEGTALVISPLISLMKDQVAALIAAGVPAAYINSSLTPGQMNLALERAAQGRYKIIYVAPERLETPAFRAFAVRAKLSLIAVDEAHCVSQWGQDFRPVYLRIADFIAGLPVRPPVGAFTATATARVRDDITRLLALQSPVSVTTGFDRPNLYFEVVTPKDRFQALWEILRRQEGRSGIVYCATRKTVEKVALKLQTLGLPTARYHAGLSDAERQRSQEDFQYDRVQVIVATNAFGMGIDKSNVSYVIHYNMPKSIEAYYQEAGRAGRDGSEAECILLYSRADIITAKFLIEKAEPNPDLTPAEQAQVRARDLDRLNRMIDYCESTRCLRAQLLRYFGQRAEDTCGHCSKCAQARYAYTAVKLPGAKPDAPRAAKRYEREDDVFQPPLYDEDSMMPVESQDGYVWDTDTPELLPMKPGYVPGVGVVRTPEEEAREQLFEQLRSTRLELSRRTRLPPYVIADDKTLREMAHDLPRDEEALLRVKGMGQVKVVKYGKPFLKVIVAWLQEHSDLAPRPPAPPAPAPAPAKSLSAEGQAPEAWEQAKAGILSRGLEIGLRAEDLAYILQIPVEQVRKAAGKR